jgi:hypothetical protein
MRCEMATDIQIADHSIRDKTPMIYQGHSYIPKELIIWYDKDNIRQCSILLADKNGTVRARLRECEVTEDGR